MDKLIIEVEEGNMLLKRTHYFIRLNGKLIKHTTYPDVVRVVNGLVKIYCKEGKYE